ncbi:hypothetical protein AB0P36_17725 [Streptomyces flavidovirens]|uniref:hypothetical protein n=1 Tax=Streptomyces flavidovirens TaxID=67298 RepID=UPI0034199C59
MSAEWIGRKTGIRERRYAATHEASSDLAVATFTTDHPQPARRACAALRDGKPATAQGRLPQVHSLDPGNIPTRRQRLRQWCRRARLRRHQP